MVRTRTAQTFRPRWIILGLLLPLAMVATAVVVTRANRVDPRAGSVRLPDGPPSAIVRTPISYAVTYRVEDSRRSVTTSRVIIRRPFDGRTETYRGEPGSSLLLDTQVSVLTRQSVGSAGGAATILATPPAPGGADVRLDSILAAALDDRILYTRERRRVAGRDCQVYRSVGPLVLGLAPFDPEGPDWADSCLDEAGLVVEEVWREQGALVRRRVATIVEENPPLADETFLFDKRPTVGIEQGAASVVEVTATAEPPGAFFVLDALPAGFSHVGRFVVVPAQGEQAIDPNQRSGLTASVVDVYRRGADMLIIDQGGNSGRTNPLPPVKHSRPAALGALGQGEIVIDPRMSEARAIVRQGKYVRVAGTIAPDQVVAVARSLRRVDGAATLGT